MGRPPTSTVQIALPHLLVLCWVTFLGVSVWQHVNASLQTPWGDGLSYLQKAIAFWQAVADGGFFNPFNLEPSVRPPGTILVSYPFGMTTDHRGFHFRSVFMPLLAIVGAVYLAAGRGAIVAQGWWVALVALLLSALPMFYWFDWNESLWLNNGWGMVDNFHAGVAALAMGALVRSLERRSLPWLVVAASLASLTLTIKQSGMMVMAVMGLAWLVVIAFQWRAATAVRRAELLRYALRGSAWFAGIYATVIALAVFSAYLSAANFIYAMRAFAYFSAVAERPTLALINPSVGIAAPVWLIGIAVMFATGSSRSHAASGADRPLQKGLLVGGLLIWMLGAWYWIVVQVSGNQVRYMFPFLLMGMVCFVPAALRVWPSAPAWIRWPLVLICIAPAANITGLLNAGNAPSFAWQKWSGVSVAVGQDHAAIRQANTLVEELRKTGKDARVYLFPSAVLPQTFITVGTYEKLIRPQLASFTPVLAMDWSRGFVVRVQELLESDFILTRKVSHDGRSVERFAARSFDTFYAESDAFDGWLSTLGQESGVEVASEGPVLRLLRIVDRAALGRAIEQFVAGHQWRPEFKAANRPAPPAWWSSASVAAREGRFVAENVSFGDQYDVRAVALAQIDNSLRVDVWWRPLQANADAVPRFLFLHLIDDSGAILHNMQVPLQPYDPPDVQRPWRHDTVTFVDVLPNRNMVRLAFGVYQPSVPNGGFLLGNNASTDWGGKRTLVPLQ